LLFLLFWNTLCFFFGLNNLSFFIAFSSQLVLSFYALIKSPSENTHICCFSWNQIKRRKHFPYAIYLFSYFLRDFMSTEKDYLVCSCCLKFSVKLGWMDLNFKIYKVQTSKNENNDNLVLKLFMPICTVLTTQIILFYTSNYLILWSICNNYTSTVNTKYRY